jgi:hypothetical protein
MSSGDSFGATPMVEFAIKTVIKSVGGRPI